MLKREIDEAQLNMKKEADLYRNAGPAYGMMVGLLDRLSKARLDDDGSGGDELSAMMCQILQTLNARVDALENAERV